MDENPNNPLNRLLIVGGAVAASTFLALMFLGFWVYQEKRKELTDPHPMYRPQTPEEIQRSIERHRER